MNIYEVGQVCKRHDPPEIIYVAEWSIEAVLQWIKTQEEYKDYTVVRIQYIGKLDNADADGVLIYTGTAPEPHLWIKNPDNDMDQKLNPAFLHWMWGKRWKPDDASNASDAIRLIMEATKGRANPKLVKEEFERWTQKQAAANFFPILSP